MCWPCDKQLNYPPSAHEYGCPKRAHLDASQERDARARVVARKPTVGEWPDCLLANCGGACGADECGT
jgi:hypothetical protein